MYAGGQIVVEVDAKSFELSADDVLFDTELPDDFVSAEFDGGNVFVNTNITPEILQEAMARELIRRVQDMRKDMDLDVEATIDVIVDCSDNFKDLITPESELISNEIRADSLELSQITESDDYYTKEWKIEDEELIIAIKK